MDTQTKVSPYYENVEFTLSDGQSDYDLDSNQAGFLADFGLGNAAERYPSFVEIRTDQSISVRINATGNDSITIDSTDSPYTIIGVEIRNLFLSNSSGSDAAVKLRFQNTPY